MSKRLVALDFETANGYSASACSIAVVAMEDGVVTDEYSTLIRPTGQARRFEYHHTRIHGIHAEDVREAPTFRDIYPRLKEMLEGQVIVAHNAKFDVGVIQACCEFYGLPKIHFNYYCTVELAKRVYPYLEHHRLNDMAEYLGVELDHHNAESDTWACLQIVLSVMTLLNEFELVPLFEQCLVRRYNTVEDEKKKLQQQSQKSSRRRKPTNKMHQRRGNGSGTRKKAVRPKILEDKKTTEKSDKTEKAEQLKNQIDEVNKRDSSKKRKRKRKRAKKQVNQNHPAS